MLVDVFSDFDAAAIQASFVENGCVIVETPDYSVFDAFNASLKVLLERYCDIEGIDPGGDDIFHGGFHRLDIRNHDHIHHIYETIRNSDTLNDIVNATMVAGTARLLLSMDPTDPLYFFFNVCRMDPPGDRKFILNWHQEDYGLGTKASSIRLWAPLVAPNGPENGSIEVLLGSHKAGELPHSVQVNDSYSSLYIPEDYLTELSSRRITVNMTPGQVLFLDPNLIHKSNHNNGKRVRYTLCAHIANPRHSAFRPTTRDDRYRLQRNSAQTPRPDPASC